MVDYEKEFQKYINVWMKKEGISPNMYQVVDDHLDVIYEEWLHTPCEAFGGKMPHHFFDEIDTAESCFKLINKYIVSDLSVPGPLLSRMVALKDEGYPLARQAIIDADVEQSVKLVTLSVELISEMDKKHPLDIYLDKIKQSAYTNDAIEAMVNVLKLNAAQMKDQLIVAYIETPHEFAKDTMLDILSELMFDEDAYKYILENFIFETSKCGMYAHMLSKVGIANCVDAMQLKLADPDLNYLNFCRVKEALEELGGETSIERDFTGDPDYEYMQTLGNDETQATAESDPMYGEDDE